MFQKHFLICSAVIGLSLSGCASQAPTQTAQETTAAPNETTVASSDSSFFEIQINKEALQSRREQEVTVFITSDAADWGFTVSAKNGIVSNVKKDSFTYTAPSGKDATEDVITVDVWDYENGIQKTSYIPLHFIPSATPSQLPL